MISQIEMEEIFNEALKKVEEKKSARLGTSEPAPPVSRATTAQVKITGSVMSFANMSRKDSSVNQNIEIASDSSDNELNDTSFLRIDSAATHSKSKGSNLNSRKSSAHTAKLTAKETTSQLYQAPSKLDNWATEHRYAAKINFPWQKMIKWLLFIYFAIVMKLIYNLIILLLNWQLF